MSKATIRTASTEQSAGRRYGLLSMLAMIVGVVVGSGIFVKNEQLWTATGGSALEGMLAWIIIAVIIIFMLIAFIEISSITKRTKEQGTVSNWSRHLWGEGSSKLIGFFFPIVYFPVLLAGLSVFASDYLFRGIEIFTGELSFGSWTGASAMWAWTGIAGVGIIATFYILNSFTNKPGKVFQAVGTGVKLIPLVAIVGLGIMVAVAPGTHGDSGWNSTIGDIFDPNSHLNAGWSGGMDSLKTILLILPAVMFSFDGFLFAASLQNEAKKPSTYKVAAISGVTFITIIYLAVTLFMYLAGNPDVEGGMTIAGAIQGIFPDQDWIMPTVIFIIFISMVTGISGNIISTQRMMSGLSYERYIVDKESVFVKRNNAGVPQASGIVSMGLTLAWFIVAKSMDGGVLAAGDMAGAYSSVSGWATDLVIVGSFSIYTFVLIGGIKNRFSYTVYTERSKAFLPAALIVAPAMMIINVYFIMDVFAFDFATTEALTESVMKLSFLTLFVFSWLAILAYSNAKTKSSVLLPQEEYNKKLANYAYANMLTLDEAKGLIEKDKPTDFGLALEVTMEKPRVLPKKKVATKKPTAKKPVAKKPVAKKTVAKKPTAKKAQIKRYTRKDLEKFTKVLLMKELKRMNVKFDEKSLKSELLGLAKRRVSKPTPKAKTK